jgi:hypothetical protein
MPYDTLERSEQDAAPVELFTFTVYNQQYLFTSASDDQLVDLRSYEAQPMEMTEPEQTGEIPRNNITIKTPQNHPMTQFYDGRPPSTVVLLQVVRYHRGDNESISYWNGRVLSCKYRGDEALFHCENIYTSLRRTGLRRLYGRGCPYDLYGPECHAAEVAFRQTIVLDAVTGIELEADALDTGSDIGRYGGGFIEWEPTPGELVRRGILSHNVRSIFLTHEIPDLVAGANVFVYPGCGHNLLDCNDFFNNIENYGGLAPYLAGKNPFGQNSVF